MRKMFVSALFVMGLILPGVSFSGGVAHSGPSLIRYTGCAVSKVSQYPEKLVVTVNNCNSSKTQIIYVHVDINNPMMLSVSTMAQNALISGKKIDFTSSIKDIESDVLANLQSLGEYVLKVYSFNLSSEEN